MTDPNENQVSFTGESLTYLKEASGWGTFLAIAGFVYAAMMICMGFFAGRIYGDILSSQGAAGDVATAIVGGFYIGIGVLFAFPCLYLFRFSLEVKNSLTRKSTQSMTIALENLKSMFKFMGIMTAISIGLMVLVIGAAVVGSMMM